MSQDLKQKTAKGIFWSSIERFSTQGIAFILSILIARQLSPDDYGIIAMLTIFFSFCNAIVDSGFSTALIRKIDRTESDNSTVFYFNIVVGFITTIFLFLSAPLIAYFFDMPLLIPITRALSITVFIGSLGTVQQVLLITQIDFKTQAKISLTTTLLSGFLGLYGAYIGWGVWALVTQMITASLLRPLLLWGLVKWRPTMPFSIESFKILFSFGSKLLASTLLELTYNNIYNLVIGKIFQASSLGYYSRAQQFAQFPSANVTGIIQRVTFPVLSILQNEDEKLANSYRKLLRVSAFIIFPLMVGLAAIAKPLIITILTEKWSGVITLLQIICFAMMWYPIHAINLNLLQVKGRSDLFLRLEIIKKIIGVIILCITVPFGVLVMCLGQVVTSLIFLVVNTHYTGKLIQVGFIRQMQDLAPSLFASLVMGGTIYYLISFISSLFLQLIVGVFVGMFFYLIIAVGFRLKEFAYLKDLISKK